MTWRLELNLMILFYLSFNSKKIWVNMFDIPEVWKQKLQPQKYSHLLPEVESLCKNYILPHL